MLLVCDMLVVVGVHDALFAGSFDIDVSGCGEVPCMLVLL